MVTTPVVKNGARSNVCNRLTRSSQRLAAVNLRTETTAPASQVRQQASGQVGVLGRLERARTKTIQCAGRSAQQEAVTRAIRNGVVRRGPSGVLDREAGHLTSRNIVAMTRR